jgi:type II secretory pathway pseudopilin PulG
MHPRTKGMTMIEAIVWIALFVTAMLAISSTILYFYRTNSYALEQSTAVAAAQRGLEQVVKVVREASFSSQGAFPIVSIAANDFVFYADVDDDPLIERVHYYLSGTNLMRGVLKPTGNPPDYVGAETTEVVAEYVRNVAQNISVFRYYDSLGAPVATSSGYTAVRFVNVTLAVNVNTATLPNQLSLSSSAALRNLIGK